MSSAQGRILVVEDDSVSRRMLRALLERAGYKCVAVANGLEALAEVPQFRPDLILMDLMMPILDGIETTRQLKSDLCTRNIPVVALTGDTTYYRQLAAREAGCDDFLAKPVNFPELLQHIRAYLSTAS